MTPDGCNTGGEPVRPGEVQNSGSIHPHPEQIDPRDWCSRCGHHTATELVNVQPSRLCPVCQDDDRRATHRVRQHSTDRGEQQHGAVSNDRAVTAQAGTLPNGEGSISHVMLSTDDGQHWRPARVVASPRLVTYTVT